MKHWPALREKLLGRPSRHLFRVLWKIVATLSEDERELAVPYVIAHLSAWEPHLRRADWGACKEFPVMKPSVGTLEVSDSFIYNKLRLQGEEFPSLVGLSLAGAGSEGVHLMPFPDDAFVRKVTHLSSTSYFGCSSLLQWIHKHSLSSLRSLSLCSGELASGGVDRMLLQTNTFDQLEELRIEAVRPRYFSDPTDDLLNNLMAHSLPSIKALWLCNMPLKMLQNKMVRLLKSEWCKSLEELRLSSWNEGYPVGALFQTLPVGFSFPKLRHLYLAALPLQQKAIRWSSVFPSLTTLSVSCSPLGSGDVEAFAKVLPCLPYLRQANFSHAGLDMYKARAFLQAASLCPSLEQLDLRGNPCGRYAKLWLTSTPRQRLLGTLSAASTRLPILLEELLKRNVDMI